MQTETLKKEKIKLPYKLLDNDYYQGDLETFMDFSTNDGADTSTVGMVVSIDFGHGECMCWKRYMVGTDWHEDPLKFDNAGTTKITTVLRYGNDGSVTIGRDVITGEVAAKGGNMHCYFKVPPSQWDDPLSPQKSFGDAIRDFLTELWRKILLYDQGKDDSSIKNALANGRLLVAMGCPASSEWTAPKPSRKLRKLIGDITGCDNVVIMPEPKAAFMSPIANAGKTSDEWKQRLTELMTTGHGICIYDLGSSTIDFTYVRMGRLLITSSIRLGGSDLDRGMLKKVENDLKDDPNAALSIDQNMRDEYSLQLRLAKEECCRGFPHAPMLKCVNRKDKAKYEYRPIPVTPEFMQEVVNAPIVMNTPTDDGSSWYQRVRKFFEDTRADVFTNLGSELDGGGFNGLIILTGGTSLVTEVRQICEKVWSAVEENPFEGDSAVGARPHAAFTVLPDPSSSVAVGLAFAKSTECAAAAKLPVMRTELMKSYEAAYDQYISNLAAFCAEVVLKYFGETVQKYNDGQAHRIQQIMNDTLSLINGSDNFTDEHMREIMGTLLGTDNADGKLAVCQREIIAEVNALSEGIYGGVLSGSIVLPEINLREDVIYYLSSAVISTLVKGVTGSVVTSTFRVLSTMDILFVIFKAITPFNWKDGPNLIQKQMQKPLTPEQIQRLEMQLGQKNEKLKKNAVKDAKELISKMDPADMKDPYFRMLDAQLEVALGKVLFLIYDETVCV